jgi:DNA-binding transcriptional MerR regulator
MSLPGYISEQEQAERLNLTIRTLRKYRQTRVGPPWVKIGKRVLYPDSLEWLADQIQQPVRSRRHQHT